MRPTPLPVAGSRADHGRESRQSITALFYRLRKTGDRDTRTALVERFMPLAGRLARRYHLGAESLDDLTQVANLALVEAVDRYDPSRGAAFTSYAAATISGSLKRHFRDNVWSAHVPRGMKERSLRVTQAAQELLDESGREASVSELATRTDLSESDVVAARGAYRALYADSLDAPAHPGSDDEPQTLADTRLGQVDPGYELAEDRVMLQGALPILTRRERRILRMRFGEDRTQADIARELGVSQTQVSRVLRRLFERLREAAYAPDAIAAA